MSKYPYKKSPPKLLKNYTSKATYNVEREMVELMNKPDALTNLDIQTDIFEKLKFLSFLFLQKAYPNLQFEYGLMRRIANDAGADFFMIWFRKPGYVEKWNQYILTGLRRQVYQALLYETKQEFEIDPVDVPRVRRAFVGSSTNKVDLESYQDILSIKNVTFLFNKFYNKISRYKKSNILYRDNKISCLLSLHNKTYIEYGESDRLYVTFLKVEFTKVLYNELRDHVSFDYMNDTIFQNTSLVEEIYGEDD